MANLKASINFGLVNIPVDVVNAEDPQDTVRFHMLDSRDNSRIRLKRINENSGREVEWEDIIKGYEVSEGKYVTFTEQELDELETEANQGLEIETFVNRDEIPAMLFESPYYLVPRKGAEKGYALLLRALENTGTCAVVQAALRNREHLAVIYPENQALIMGTLRYENEVKKPSEVLPSSISKMKVSEKEVSIAEKLVKEMKGKFKPSKYKDHYVLKVKAAIKKKSRKKLKTSSKRQPDKAKSPKVADIMALLNKSLSKKSNRKTAHKRAA